MVDKLNKQRIFYGMNTLEIIKARRAVKHYDPHHRLSKDEIEVLLQSAIQAPTSFNIQNWRFVVVHDRF